MCQQWSSLEVIAMCSHMAIQVSTLRESGITNLALVRFLPCVSTVVLGKGRAICKALATGSAFVGSVT